MILETLLLFTCYFYHVHAACENLLTDRVTMTVIDEIGKQRQTFRNCEDLVDTHPILCKRGPGKRNGQCCALCRQKKPQLKCIDDTLKRFGEKLLCEQYVREDPCRCEDKELGLKKTCCASCKEYECPKCRDTLSEDNAIEVEKIDGTMEMLTDCETLVTNYLSLCKREHGRKRGRCCQSCSEEDLSCIDNSFKYFMVNDQRMSCADYVADDPCRCKKMQVKRTCCKSCEYAECPCEDSETWTGTVKYKGEICEDCTCQQIKDRGEDWMIKACRPQKAMARKECCKSCTELGFPPRN